MGKHNNGGSWVIALQKPHSTFWFNLRTQRRISGKWPLGIQPDGLSQSWEAAPAHVLYKKDSWENKSMLSISNKVHFIIHLYSTFSQTSQIRSLHWTAYSLRGGTSFSLLFCFVLFCLRIYLQCLAQCWAHSSYLIIFLKSLWTDWLSQEEED